MALINIVVYFSRQIVSVVDVPRESDRAPMETKERIVVASGTDSGHISFPALHFSYNIHDDKPTWLLTTDGALSGSSYARELFGLPRRM